MNEQPYAPVPPQYTPGTQLDNGHNPYEFIMQADAKHQKHGGDLFIRKLLIIVGSVAAFFIVAAILLSALVPNNNPTDKMYTIATEQQAIATVAATAANQATSESAKAIALNTQLAMQTAANDTLKYVQDNGGKADKSFAKLDDANAEAQLKAVVESPATYNATVHKVLSDLLSKHITNLKTTYDATKNQNARQVLSQAFVTANKLVEQNSASSD